MPQFVLTYYGEPKVESPEQGAAGYERWQAWVRDLGDAVVNPGTPLGAPKTVSASGVTDCTTSDRSTGFSIVRADGIDAAVEMAKRCPFLEFGTIDVAEVMEMGG
jgi:hypothetical protein